MCVFHLFGRVERKFQNGARYNVFHLGAHESRALARFDVLKLYDDVYVAVVFDGDALSEISCCNHKIISFNLSELNYKIINFLSERMNDSTLPSFSRTLSSMRMPNSPSKYTPGSMEKTISSFSVQSAPMRKVGYS